MNDGLATILGCVMEVQILTMHELADVLQFLGADSKRERIRNHHKAWREVADKYTELAEALKKAGAEG